MFRYRLHSPDGDDLGEATYAMMIKPGEEIIAGGNQRFCVVDVVPFDEEDESPFVGLLQVEAAQGLGDSPLVRIDAVQLPATADSLLSPCVQARPESDVFSACGAR